MSTLKGRIGNLKGGLNALYEEAAALPMLVVKALRESSNLFKEMDACLRHFLAKEVLAYRQKKPDWAFIPDSDKAELHAAASERAFEVFSGKYDLAVDLVDEGDDEARALINKGAFLSYAASRTEILSRITKMGTAALALEIAETGVIALNNHWAWSYPKSTIKAGVAMGSKKILAADRRGISVDMLPAYKRGGSSPGALQVF